MTQRATHQQIIRLATPDDALAIWDMYRAEIASGNAFMHDDTLSYDDLRRKWYAPQALTFVACLDGNPVGAYTLYPNQPGYGSHVANGTYVIDAAHRGQQIGRRLGQHSLQRATEAGYQAMQFNAVVSTNIAAVNLWLSLGFSIVGTVPAAFQHPQLGLVDLHIMHRFLP